MGIFGGGSDAASAARKQQQQQQQKIDAATGQINAAFAGFDPAFYQARTKAYETYAMPQLNQQYQNVQSGLYGKLANQGLLNSSAAGVEKGAMQQSLAEAQQNIANAALQQSQALQRQVGQEKANLIGQANVAASPLSVSQSALESASGFSAPSPFAPIGQMFQGFGNMYLGSQVGNTYNPTLQSYMLGGNKQPAVGGAGLGMSSQIYQ